MTQDNSQLQLAVIVASVRDGRFGPVPARWFVEHAQLHDTFDVTVLDLAEVSLPHALPPGREALLDVGSRSAPLIDLANQLDAADAFVIVTPEYNHSFPASIKHLIDWHFTQWEAKPIGFVSYGGVSGGLRAVEQLRLVLAELHAVTVRDTVSFTNYWELLTADGTLDGSSDANEAATIMLDQLGWWADALRAARHRAPYGTPPRTRHNGDANAAAAMIS